VKALAAKHCSKVRLTPSAPTSTMSATTSGAQSSDFFNLIYGYMTLPGIRNQDAKSWLGFAATCQQAKQEAEEEGMHHLWQ
jgi:hypothetical protein